MHLVRVTQSPWIRSPRERHALASVAERPCRVLRAVTAPSLAPALTPRLPAPAPLVKLVHMRGGRVVVTNPVAVARLPHAVASLVRAAIATALTNATEGADAGDDGREEGRDTASERATATAATGPALPGAATFGLHPITTARGDRRLTRLVAHLPDAAREALAPGAAWAAVALYEPDALEVQLPIDGPTPIAPEPPSLVAFSRYRLVVVTGRGAPPESWDALDAAALAAPTVAWPPTSAIEPWFVVRLLVSDAHVAAHMDATTLARWATLTGRTGPGSRDLYWYADTWERFREPGRRVGHVTPQVVGQSRRSRLSDEVREFGALALTPDVERGVGVPPGYCLVDCAGLLDIAVLAA